MARAVGSVVRRWGSIGLVLELFSLGCLQDTTRDFGRPGQSSLPDAGSSADLATEAGATADAELDWLIEEPSADATADPTPDEDDAEPLPDAPPDTPDARTDTPLDVPPPDIWRVVVISDLNGSYGSTTYGDPVLDAVDRVIALEPDLVLSTGDMVAGQQAGHDYRAMWAAFREAVSDPLAAAGIPFAVTPGNHDASGYSAFAGERAIFVDEWAERRPDVAFLDDSDYPLRYSFTLGPILFVSLDDTIVGPLSVPDLEWIEDQLEAGIVYPIKILFGHVPLYAFTEGREDEIRADFELEELLAAYGVTAFISGHHHAYYPGRRGDLRLVSMACLGSGPRRLIGEEEASTRAILVLEIGELGIETLDGYGGAAFDALIERDWLPEAVGDEPMRIWRDDVVP